MEPIGIEPLMISGRLPTWRVGQRRAIEDRDPRPIEDQLFPTSELPDESQVGGDGRGPSQRPYLGVDTTTPPEKGSLT
jgi:hypothetical protein